MCHSAPDISVAIVSYNTRNLLRACLHSLLARQADGEASLEIIVADNGSSDGSVEMVQAEFPSVQVIETGENLGFGRANNLALLNAQGRAYCLLNSDAEVLPGALSLPLAALDADPTIGLAGGQLLWPDGRLQTSYGDDPTLAGVFREQTFLSAMERKRPPPPAQAPTPPPSERERGQEKRKGLPSISYPSLTKWGRGMPRTALLRIGAVPGVGATLDVHQICGAFMLIRPQAWREAGGFDPHYFMYNEDVDLNFRLRRAGWRVVFLPQARITHHLGASSSADWQKRARMVSAYNESRFYFFSRFYGPSAGAKLRACCLLGAAIRFSGWFLLSLVRPSAKDKVKLFREVWRRTWTMTAST